MLRNCSCQYLFCTLHSRCKCGIRRASNSRGIYSISYNVQIINLRGPQGQLPESRTYPGVPVYHGVKNHPSLKISACLSVREYFFYQTRRFVKLCINQFLSRAADDLMGIYAVRTCRRLCSSSPLPSFMDGKMLLSYLLGTRNITRGSSVRIVSYLPRNTILRNCTRKIFPKRPFNVS